MTRSLEVEYAVRCGRRYWPSAEDLVARIDVPVAELRADAAPLVGINLPDWAADCGVGQPPALLVPEDCIVPGAAPSHERVDWWRAAFVMLSARDERAHERVHGPAHSYAFRLRGVDARLFDNAWVNRIFLYLRRRAAYEHRLPESQLFGELPPARIEVTFDLDAVRKTPEIRMKQGVFHGLNAIRHAARREFRPATRRLRQAVRTGAGSGRYDRLAEVSSLLAERGLTGLVHAYAGPLPRRGFDRLLDPAYDVRDPQIAKTLVALLERGWQVGVHPGYSAWRDSRPIAQARESLSSVLGREVERARQHWLRFSFGETWRAQSAAGIRVDSTLGFNDRPGFRAAAALRFPPWDDARGEEHDLEVVPLVLMDSHVYDYGLASVDEEAKVIRRWLDEVESVRGEAAILWHPHSLDPDYGWRRGLETVLSIVSA